MEGETDLVPPARTDHGAKDHICLEDFGVGPIDARAPPWVPDIVEQQDSAGRRLGFDHHFGVGIAQQARAADRAGGRAARESDRRLLEQHGATRIDARPAGAQELVEIGEAPVRQQHHPGQRARVLVDVGILRACDEIEIAGRERGVDLLHRHAGGDKTHAEEIGEGGTVGGIERRKHALARNGDGVAHMRRLLEPAQPQRIVAEYVIEILHEREVWPVIFDSDQLHAVAPVRRGGAGEPRLEEPHRLVVGVRTQRVESAGRQRGRNMRSVVPAEVERHERRDQRDGGHGRARVEPTRQPENRDRRRREDDRGRHGNQHRPNADDGSGQRQRAGDQCNGARDLERALQARGRRHRAGEPTMDEIAGNHRDQGN